MAVAQGTPMSTATMQAVQYPLTLNFKVLAFGPQIFVKDASGREILFVHQKALKLKEDINVYTDSKKTTQLFNIKADRVIDFSANYTFTDNAGNVLGKIKREGMRSIFKASYNLMDGAGNVVGHIKEDNGWIKVIDALVGELPVIGIFSGYFFNPTYTLYRGQGLDQPLLHIKKEPAFLEGKFTVHKKAEPMNATEESAWLLGTMMMVLLERMRG
jgi:uncharacterized protein YxjI